MRRRERPQLPQLHHTPSPSAAASRPKTTDNKWRVKQHRQEVKRALLSVDDRLKKLDSSNDRAMRSSSTIKSREKGAADRQRLQVVRQTDSAGRSFGDTESLLWHVW